MSVIEIQLNEPALGVNYIPAGKVRTENPYLFDFDQFGFPAFTEKNLAFVSALIENDSDYNGEDDKIAQAYKNLFSDGGQLNENNLALIVDDIDRVNTTHLAAEGPRGGGGGRKKTIERISGISNLRKRLLEKDDSLIADIGKMEQKYNFSFATKFCAYVSLRSLKQDNYCIFDNVVADVLPYYVYMYADNAELALLGSCCRPLLRGPRKGIIVSTVGKNARENVKNNSRKTKGFKEGCSDGDDASGYSCYRGLVDAVLKGIASKSKKPITIEYKQFDNLVWYYFKGKAGVQRRGAALRKIRLP